jgi:hypothetical protein
MSINPLRSFIDQLRTHVATKAKDATQTPVLIITIEEILEDECWLVRYGNNMTMYIIQGGEFTALSAADMGLTPGSDEAADTYAERYAGAVLRSRLREQGQQKTP